MDRKDELRRQFGTVWRMASSGLDTLKQVVVRSSQAGKLRVDLALLAREKQHLLATLGAHVRALVETGELELPESSARLVERLGDLDARIAATSARTHDNAFGAPRGFEPEAYDDDLDALDELHEELDEHAQVAGEAGRKGALR